MSEAGTAAASAVASASEAAPAATQAASAADDAASAAAASAAASAPAAPVVVPAPAPVEEPSFLDSLADNPLVLPGLGLLLAALAGLGLYRARQRKKDAAPLDSSFIESRLQPDSFFGASGGQRVNTKEGGSSVSGNSSMAYSPSQLDAAGDVDPVAEADVYLAYGRDMQAEEILKEAVRHNPTRVSIHAKLAELSAKRQDRTALESVASEIHQLTKGEGSDWNRVAELGRSLDAENPLYQPGGRPAGASALAAGAMAGAAAATPPDLDLDLDLDLPDDALTEAPPAPAGAFAAAAQSVQHPVPEDLSLIHISEPTRPY